MNVIASTCMNVTFMILSEWFTTHATRMLFIQNWNTRCVWEFLAFLLVIRCFSILQLAHNALLDLVRCEEFHSVDGHQNLVQLIAAVHVVHHMFRAEIQWFGQLASSMPQILHVLERANNYTDSEEMVKCRPP